MFELKTTVIGADEEKEGRLLNRVVRYTNQGWGCEADQRHAEFIIRAFNLQNAKAVNTPQEEAKPWLAREDEQKLGPDKAAEYRSLAARANYFASDRIDVQCSVKELCRSMSDPTNDRGQKKNKETCKIPRVEAQACQRI